MDLWSLFDFLMPGFLGTERKVCILTLYLCILNCYTMFPALYFCPVSNKLYGGQKCHIDWLNFSSLSKEKVVITERHVIGIK